ncbi:MAG TPA: hypothetical protein VFP35_04245 [Candidatus Saccharimonadales bacterium]|nr:hypothetical protein [Candidatus Saccharimonadales bacterium]
MANKNLVKPFYDPAKSYDDNFDNGPFGASKVEPYVNQGEPQFSFLGIPLYAPFGIAAGPLLNSRFVKFALEAGFDVPVYKTQRSIQFPANQFPNVLYINIDGDLTLDRAAKPLIGRRSASKPVKELTITNSFGNPSRGPDFWTTDLKKVRACQGKGQLVIGSAVGSIKEGFSSEDYFDDFALAAEMVTKTGVDVVEINLSCPNVATEGVLCYTLNSVVAICQKVRAKIGNKPLVIKLGYFSPEQEPLLVKVLKEAADYINAISAINTIPAPVVDESGRQALPGPNRLSSGICGHAIKWAGLDMVSRLAAIRKKLGLKFEIIGVGGVMTPADFKDYRGAGADLVQTATGAMWNPGLAAEIKKSLKV